MRRTWNSGDVHHLGGWPGSHSRHSPGRSPAGHPDHPVVARGWQGRPRGGRQHAPRPAPPWLPSSTGSTRTRTDSACSSELLVSLSPGPKCSRTTAFPKRRSNRLCDPSSTRWTTDLALSIRSARINRRDCRLRRICPLLTCSLANSALRPAGLVDRANGFPTRRGCGLSDLLILAVESAAACGACGRPALSPRRRTRTDFLTTEGSRNNPSLTSRPFNSEGVCHRQCLGRRNDSLHELSGGNRPSIGVRAL